MTCTSPVQADVDLRSEAPVETNFASIKDSSIWHRRFCHVNKKAIEELATHNKVRGIDDIKINNDACYIRKSTKSSCKKRIKNRQNIDVYELIHSDLCGPMPVKS